MKMSLSCTQPPQPTLPQTRATWEPKRELAASQPQSLYFLQTTYFDGLASGSRHRKTGLLATYSKLIQGKTLCNEIATPGTATQHEQRPDKLHAIRLTRPVKMAIQRRIGKLTIVTKKTVPQRGIEDGFPLATRAQCSHRAQLVSLQTWQPRS